MSARAQCMQFVCIKLSILGLCESVGGGHFQIGVKRDLGTIFSTIFADQT